MGDDDEDRARPQFAEHVGVHGLIGRVPTGPRQRPEREQRLERPDEDDSAIGTPTSKQRARRLEPVRVAAKGGAAGAPADAQTHNADPAERDAEDERKADRAEIGAVRRDPCVSVPRRDVSSSGRSRRRHFEPADGRRLLSG